MLEQFGLGDIEAHLHGSHNLALLVFDRGGVDDPMGGGSIFANASLFAKMRQTVFKRSFNRADHAFFLAPLIGSVTGVAGFGLEFFIKFFVIADEFIVAVLNRDNTGNPFEQILVFIALPVQFGLFFADFFAHPVNRNRQLPHLINLAHINLV